MRLREGVPRWRRGPDAPDTPLAELWSEQLAQRRQVGTLCWGLSSGPASPRIGFGAKGVPWGTGAAQRPASPPWERRWGLTAAVAAGFRSARSPGSLPQAGRFGGGELAMDHPPCAGERQPSAYPGRPHRSVQRLLRGLVRFHLLYKPVVISR